MSAILTALTRMYDAPTKSLRLDPASVGVSGLVDALQEVFGQARLTFQALGAPPAESGTTVSFAGSGLLLQDGPPGLRFPATAVDRVTFTVYQSETDPVVVIAAVLKPRDGEWVTCLPMLRGGFWAGIAWVPISNAGITIGPALVFASKAARPDPWGADLPRGLSLYGQVDPKNGIVKRVAGLLKTSTPAAAGLTFDKANVPRLTFPVGRATFPAIFGADPSDLDVSLVSVDDPRQCGLKLRAAFPWPGQPHATFSAVFATENPGIICFAADQPLDLPSASDFKQLATFFGANELHDSLPGQFKGGSKVELSELSLGVGLFPSPHLEHCCLVLEAQKDQALQLLSDPDIAVQDLQFHFTVYRPGMKDSEECTFSLNGLLEIEKTWFEVTGSLRPGRAGGSSQVSAGISLAHLDSKNVISLTQIADHVHLVADGAPDVAFTELSIGVVKDTSWTFNLSGRVEDISMGSAKPEWAIESVGFAIDKSAGSAANCHAEGVLAVAGTTLQVTLDHQRGGWTFTAATLPGQKIHVGDLIDDLLDQFGGKKQTNLASFEIDSLSLRISLDQKGRSYKFDVAAAFQIASKSASSTLSITVSEQANVFSRTIDGTLTVGEESFEVVFDTTNAGTSFSGNWKPTNQNALLELRDLAAPLSDTLAAQLKDIPSNLDLQLEGVAVGYDETDAIFGLTAHSKSYGTLAFGIDRQPGGASPPTYVVFLDIGKTIGLADVPLVGSALPFADAVKVGDISVLFASAAVAQDRLTRMFQCFTRCDPQYTRPGFDTIDHGGRLKATLHFAQSQSPLEWRFANENAPAVAHLAAAGTAPADDTTWYAIDKTFGPLVFRRVGFKYADGELYFILDVSLHVSALTFTLDGLSVSSQLSDFAPHVHLQGLEVDFVAPAFSVSGGLKAAPAKQIDAGDFEYDGELAVRAESFSIMAEGSYARVTDPLTKKAFTSFFLFARLDAPLGGPPYFFVTGLAGGFGYNRKLRIPKLEEVGQFPLVAGLSDPGAIGGAGATPGQVLQQLSEWVPASDGDMFVAAGIHFTSFDFVNTIAALAVEFGGTFEILLVGLSTARIATGGETYAYGELALEASVRPSDGIFSATATLTPNSYLLDPACHLTGGFAFMIWFGGDNRGDFVFTIGGYHPAFLKPAQYPVEQRVGFNWLVSPTITMQGGVYFALTPSCVMTGGALEATYHSGDLRAWFTAHADFLVTWKPFHFDANIGVGLGASYQLDCAGIHHTFKVSLAASVHLWGPAIGGKVHVQWFVISFTVSFGPGPSTPAMGWEQFAALLPRKTKPLAAPMLVDPKDDDVDCFHFTALDGLTGKPAGDPLRWMVRPEGFAFAISSAIPASRIEITNLKGDPQRVDPDKPYGVDIRPLGVTGATTILTVTVRGGDKQPAEVIPAAVFDWGPASANVPEAMWGVPLAPHTTPRPAATTLPDRLVGLRRVAPKPPVVSGPPVITMATAYAAVELCPDDQHYLGLSPRETPAKVPSPVANAGSLTLIGKRVMDASVAGQRDAVYNDLVKLGFAPSDHGPLSKLAEDPLTAFRTPPMTEAANA